MKLSNLVRGNRSTISVAKGIFMSHISCFSDELQTSRKQLKIYSSYWKENFAFRTYTCFLGVTFEKAFTFQKSTQKSTFMF